MRVFVAAALFSALALSSIAAASADPADDINQAIRAFAAVKSVHVDLTAATGSGTQDMVAPNKSKESYTYMERQIQVVKIGPDRWINVDGQWRKTHSASDNAIDSQIDQARKVILDQKDIREGYTVSDGGMATIGAVPAHKYHLVDKNKSSEHGDVFIGPDHLPLRIVIDTTLGPLTYTYSRYNSIPDFNAPI